MLWGGTGLGSHRPHLRGPWERNRRACSRRRCRVVAGGPGLPTCAPGGPAFFPAEFRKNGGHAPTGTSDPWVPRASTVGLESHPAVP